MRILVTGADGFIGRHVARSLERAGHDVLRSVYAREAGPGEVRVDLADRAALARLPRRVEAVVHAAGAVDAHLSLRTMLRANVHATEHLTAWAAAARVRHFVHLSSVAVYGPLLLGEQRSEQTPRLGLLVGLPYMLTKARAERVVEHSGVPYTLLRPPAVLGQGDSVVTRGFIDARRRGGLPMLPGASRERLVSLVFVDGLSEIIRRLLEHGPLGAPLHAVDVELSLGALAQAYERALGTPLSFAPTRWAAAVHNRNEVGLAWLQVSARFGQHYLRERLVSELGYRSRLSLDSAIQSGLSGLQPPNGGLF
jgi:dihydroflavonol-4-reductase